MTVYVALLRGINVGHKQIKMDSLKALFESLQFQHARTYIQSGNVIFEAAETDPFVLRDKLENGLRKAYGFEVAVIVRTVPELEEAIRRNPWAEAEAPGPKKLYVTFLAEKPSAEAIRHFETYRNDLDECRVVNREVYILCGGSYGKTRFSNAFVEKKLKVPGTTRNWETINTLAEMAGGPA